MSSGVTKIVLIEDEPAKEIICEANIQRTQPFMKKKYKYVFEFELKLLGEVESLHLMCFFRC